METPLKDVEYDAQQQIWARIHGLEIEVRKLGEELYALKDTLWEAKHAR